MPISAEIIAFPKTKLHRSSLGKRRTTRERCWIKVVIEDQSSRLHDGIIVDISDKGSRLRTRNEIQLSSSIIMHGFARSSPKLCRVAWRRDNEVGLEFIA
jgi:hypothetical protein